MNILRKIQNFISTNWGIFLAMTVVCFIVMAPVLVLHRTTIFVNLDNVDQFYTWYQKLATSWHNGYLPIWNANVYSGSSFAGELQQGVLYPINWLWVALFGSVRGISELALNYLVTLHFVIASYGCYLLLTAMKAKKWSSFAAGLVFAFSGALAVRAASQTVIFFALTWLPYPLYFYIRYRYASRQKWWNLVLSGASLGLILMVGHIQPFFHAFLALVVIELVYLRQHVQKMSALWPNIRTSIKNGAIIGASAVAIALPQLWVSASYLPNAYRVQARGYVAPGVKIDYDEFSQSFNLNPHEFANMIDPVSYPVKEGNEPFIGLAPLLVIVLALAIARQKFKQTALWKEHGYLLTTLLVLAFVAMLGYVTWFAVVLYKLPLVYQIRQLGRYVVLFDLALVAVLAASLEALATKLSLTKQQKKTLLLIGGFLLIQSLYLLALRNKIFGKHLTLQYGVAAIMTLAFVVSRKDTLRKQLLIGAMAATVVVNGFWFLPKLKSDTKTPKDYAQPAALVDTIEKTSGYYRLSIQENALPINIGNVYDVQTTAGYSATMNASYFRFAHSGNVDSRFVDDILGVSLTAKKTVLAGEPVIYKDESRGIVLVARPTALPKFFTTNNPGSLNRGDYSGLDVETQEYTDHYQKYTVRVGQQTKAIASELYYPGWVARVDGKEAQLSEYAFGSYPLLKQVSLEKGEHTVEFRYKPFKFF